MPVTDFRNICLGCPHAMIVLYHAIVSKNQLLRGEVLTILETMRSRLAAFIIQISYCYPDESNLIDIMPSNKF